MKRDFIVIALVIFAPCFEMSLSVGWNRLLMRLFLPKLCSMATEETESDIDL